MLDTISVNGTELEYQLRGTCRVRYRRIRTYTTDLALTCQRPAGLCACSRDRRWHSVTSWMT